MTLPVALAQINPTVGNVPGNVDAIRRARDRAATQGAALVAFPELTLVGYPPEDLVLRPALVDAAAHALDALIADSRATPIATIVGLPWIQDGRLHNAAALVANGQVQLTFKHNLPNYGVFDEKRVFTPGPLPEPLLLGGMRIGVPICEDIWRDEVATHLASRGAELLIVPNGSPFEVDKLHQRHELAARRAGDTHLPLIYVNQVGGQDELVFDGGSFAVNADGTLAHALPFWEEAVHTTRWERRGATLACARGDIAADEPRLASIYHAMMLGLRDYVDKNGFRGIVLGMSGGIDSALTAAVAVDALGAERVHGVRLPSRFTSEASLDDARESAERLGMALDTMPIDATVTALESALQPLFAGRPRDVTEENLQARARGVLLMALSNKFGELLVTTGNKSEMSVGYATLYGDMCGGYSVLKDIYKTEVYALARWRNAHHPRHARGPEGRAIPESSISKAPTAELRPNQTDQDSLPPYDELDAILRGLIEDERSVGEIVADGFSHDTVTRIQRMLYAAEYKRRQAPPGVKITRKSFGRDRRYPLTNGFREA